MGIVVIGRNEGSKLKESLDSARGSRRKLLYVDSGSSDGSSDLARSMGLHALDLESPPGFTAARARNAGWRYLSKMNPSLVYVQFLDGDCILDPAWTDSATSFLENNAEYAVVAGRLKEKHPEASVYNRLCELEWAVPAGESDSCGGIAMMRLSALLECNGFREDMTAGEEPELCWRMKRAGWRVMRLELPMALHDAAMTSFDQWWKRSVRSGHAAAQLWDPVARTGTRHGKATILRSLGWGIALPLLSIGASLLMAYLGHWTGALAALALPLLAGTVQVTRMAVRDIGKRSGIRDAAIGSLFNWVSKTPEGLGVLQHWLNRARGRGTPLVEYKSTRSAKHNQNGGH